MLEIFNKLCYILKEVIKDFGPNLYLSDIYLKVSQELAYLTSKKKIKVEEYNLKLLNFSKSFPLHASFMNFHCQSFIKYKAKTNTA